MRTNTRLWTLLRRIMAWDNDDNAGYHAAIELLLDIKQCLESILEDDGSDAEKETTNAKSVEPPPLQAEITDRGRIHEGDPKAKS